MKKHCVAVLSAALFCSLGADARAQTEFDDFEAPALAALLPVAGFERDPALARAVESMATRLLLESGRYRLMLPWETRAHGRSRGLELSAGGPTQARAAAAALGVSRLIRLELGPSRRLSLTVVESGEEAVVRTRVGALSRVPELLDRDVGLLLEQAQLVRPVYRVRPPYTVRAPRKARARRGGFERMKRRVFAYLRDPSHDPAKKLALAEAVIAAHSGLEHPAFEELLAARRQLLAGRAFFGPVTDAHCRDQLDCRRLGRCRGGELTCVATSNTDCRRSESCKKDGRCAAVDGQCIARGATCEHSYACLAEGRCEVHAGLCLVPDAAACARSTQCEEVGACQLSFGACSTHSSEKISVAAE